MKCPLPYNDIDLSISLFETVYQLGIRAMSVDETGKWAKRLDKMGMSASFFCAIHCALIPIVAGVLPLLGLSILGSHAIEDTVIGAAFIIASLSLVPSYFRVHQKALALVMFVVGFTMIIVGHAITQEWIAVPMAVAGGLGVAIAHWVNHRECKNCPKCQGGCDHVH